MEPDSSQWSTGTEQEAMGTQGKTEIPFNRKKSPFNREGD